MSKKKYGTSIAYQNEGCNPLQTIDLVKSLGFDCCFLKWYDENWEISQFQQAEYCHKIGLPIDFAHLGYQKIGNIWNPDEENDIFVKRFCQDLDDCKQYGIDRAIIHCNGYKPEFPVNETGLQRYRRIIQHGHEIGVKVDIENTGLREYPKAIWDYCKDLDNLFLCFDSGHYHCYFKDDWDLSPYKGRIGSVHLHDNNGRSDDHMIPFDGNIDWNTMMKRIVDNKYNGPMMLELMYFKDYPKKMSIEQFYQNAFQSAKILYRIRDEIKSVNRAEQ